MGYAADSLLIKWQPVEVEIIEEATKKVIFKQPIYPWREKDFE
jgi:hypothetical protein